MTIIAHKNIRIVDAWVLNKSDPRRISAYFQIEQTGIPNSGFDSVIACQIIDPSSGKVLAEKGSVVDSTKAGKTYVETLNFSCKDAELWNLKNPKLYYLRISTNPLAKSLADQFS
jgi:hypothetical protein